MYQNNFTRANPGLILILIDQSGSMRSNWSDGKSLAEHTALVINRCIAEMGLRFTSGTTIKESADIFLIGYGGEPSYSAQIIRKGTIRDFVENPIRREMVKQRQYNREIGFYDIDFELPINIEPVVGYVTPMIKAFELAFSVVQDWVKRDSSRDVLKDPVPIIINISDGAPTDENGYIMDDFSPVIKEADNIKGISCPDGNPLIFNIHLSPNSNMEEIQFPRNKSEIPNGDEMSGLLFDLSSSLPDTMVEAGHISGFPSLTEGVKTFMSNVKEVEKFVQFLNFGTKGTDGNRLIR